MGLSPARASALSVVVFGGRHTIGDLAHAEHVSAPTMTRLVVGMERDGLIRREHDARDGRIVWLRPTDEGHAHPARRTAPSRRRARRAVGDAPERDRQTLASAAEILENMLRAGPRAAARRRPVRWPRSGRSERAADGDDRGGARVVLASGLWRDAERHPEPGCSRAARGDGEVASRSARRDRRADGHRSRGPRSRTRARVRTGRSRCSPASPSSRTSWEALIGIDPRPVKPGTYPVAIDADAGRLRTTYSLIVAPKRAFPLRRLTVDESFVNPPPSEQARHRARSETAQRRVSRAGRGRLWTAPFVRPVAEPANSRFGTRSVFSGVRAARTAAPTSQSERHRHPRAERQSRRRRPPALFFRQHRDHRPRPGPVLAARAHVGDGGAGGRSRERRPGRRPRPGRPAAHRSASALGGARETRRASIRSRCSRCSASRIGSPERVAKDGGVRLQPDFARPA